MKRIVAAVATAAAWMATGEAVAQSASAVLIDPDGAEIGRVTLSQVAQGVHLVAEAEGLPPGVHAFHIHAIGLCDTPDFTSAGGHFNPGGTEHGWNNPAGPHAGDFPNVHVHADGKLAVEYFNAALTLGEGEGNLFDDDGSAIVMHEGADDYQTDPAGAAGARIACGVITR